MKPVLIEPAVNLSNSRVPGRGAARGSHLNIILEHISTNVLQQTNALMKRVSISMQCQQRQEEVQNQEQEIQKYSEAYIKRVVQIQAYIKMKMQLKSFHQLVKKCKKRLLVIEELVQSENKYVNYLTVLFNKVCQPLRIITKYSSTLPEMVDKQLESLKLTPPLISIIKDMKSITQSDVNGIFSNIDDLIELNEQLASKMDDRLKQILSSCPKYNQMFADVFVVYVPFLTIYVEYLNNYQNAQNTLNRLTNSNQSFKAFRQYIETNELEELDIQDYLIKPVQRLPLYPLLLSELKKNTPIHHKDYQNVINALEKFEEVCSRNNESMDQFIRANKLVSLHKKFSNHNINNMYQVQNSNKDNGIIPYKQTIGNNINNNEQHQNLGLQIIESEVQRNFIWEEMLQLFTNNQERRVIVYFLSDMLLVTFNQPNQKEVLLKYLQLNESSFLKNMTDLKYFSNLFRVIGKNESLTFTCDSDEIKSNLIQRINSDILIPLKLKARQRMQIKFLQSPSQSILSQGTTNSTENPKNYRNSNPNDTIDEESKQEDSTPKQNIQASNQTSKMATDLINQGIEFPIQVSVLGTEERASANKLKETFTVYITEIQIGQNVKQKIFVRYKEMIELEKFIKKNIKEIKDVPHLSRDIFYHHKTKVIEQRKLLIENFLQKVLSNPLLKSHTASQNIFTFLGLPKNFFQLPLLIGESDFEILQLPQQTQQQASQQEKEYQQPARPMKVSYFNTNLEECDEGGEDDKDFQDNNLAKNRISTDNDSSLLQSSERPQSIVIGASNIYQLNSQKQRSSQNVGNDSSEVLGNKNQSSNINANINSKTILEEEKEIEVNTLNGNIKIVISSNRCRAFDMCVEVARKLNLANYLDFRIFLEDESKKTIRLLDDDENVYKLLFYQNIQLDANGAKTNLKNAVLNKLGFNTTQQKHQQQFILFRKYLWLEQELEEFDYKSDSVRLQLMGRQILNDIQYRKCILQTNDYLLFTSLYLFLYHSHLFNNQHLLIDLQKSHKTQLLAAVKQFLPQQVIKLFKENALIENIIACVNTISEQLQIALNNANQLLAPSSQSDTQSQSQGNNGNCDSNYEDGVDEEEVENHLYKVNSDILSDVSNVVCMIILDSFKRNVFYGASLFQCQTYKSTIKQAKSMFNMTFPSNVLCCVKCDAIHILDSSKQTIIKTFIYNEIKETKVFPSSIIFISITDSDFQYRFDTTQSFEISQIIAAYQDMIQDIQKNSQNQDQTNISATQ